MEKGLIDLGRLCFFRRKPRLLTPGVTTAGAGGQEIRAAGLRHAGKITGPG